MATGDHQRVFVLGLDGVPFDLLDAWIEAGELDNFARLADGGVFASLRSTVPATTALAWPSIASGCWPDRHGCYGFYRLTADYRQSANSSADIDQPRLWDMLSPSVVGNVPMTYPAGEIDGKLVAGMMTPNRNQGFVHPDELGQEIETRIPDYSIGLDWGEYHDRKDDLVADVAAMVDTRRELMRLLMEDDEWRLFFFVFTAPDRLQHLVWDEEVLLQHYRHLDNVVGEVMDYVTRSDSTLYVVSDHGFGPISWFVNANTILERNGYLTVRTDEGTRQLFDRLGIRKSRVLGAFDAFGISERALMAHLPQSVVDAAATRIPGEHGRYDVDYSESMAFVHGPGNVYINDADRFEKGTIPPSNRAAVKADLIEVFSGVSTPSGASALEVHDGAELFPNDPRSPDVVIDGANGCKVTTELSGEPLSDPGSHAGDHRQEGILFVWGPPIDAGGHVTDATVVDIAPTVLHNAGEPVPRSADGRVLTEVFAAGSPPTREVVRQPYSPVSRAREPPSRDTDEVEARLKGLGYLDS